MAKPASEQRVKHAILQQVYHDNLGQTGAVVAKGPPKKRSPARAQSMVFWALGVVLIGVTAVSAWWMQPAWLAVAFPVSAPVSSVVLAKPPPVAIVPAEINQAPQHVAQLVRVLQPRPALDSGSWQHWYSPSVAPPTKALATTTPPPVAKALLNRYAAPSAVTWREQAQPKAVKTSVVRRETVSNDYSALLAPDAPSLANLFGLRVRTIVIDAGHGGKDSGAIGPNGLQEKHVTLEVAKRLAERLRQRESYRVILTRSDDRYLTLRERVVSANTYGADLFISIHVNALPQPWHAFVETYYFGAGNDAHTVSLAEKENRDSDYALAEFRQMINKIGDTVKQQESRALAQAIQKDLYRNMSQHERKIINRGISTAPFVVLLGTEMPSTLVEITSITNVEEEARLATAEYRDEIARYLEQGIVDYLETSRVKLAEGK